MNARRFSRLLLAAGLMVAASAGSAAARQAQATAGPQARADDGRPAAVGDGAGAGRFPHHDRQAGERPAVLHPPQPAAGEPGRTPPRDQRRVGARRRRPARAGARGGAHGLQRHEALPGPGDHGLHGVDRHAVRAEPERLHDVRRHDVRAAGADRSPRNPGEGLPHPGGLGAQPHLRRARDRQGAGRHRRGMAAGARGVCPAPGQAVPDRAGRIALRGAQPDRHQGVARHLLARPAQAVLPGLVPARPDGGCRRRRFRPARDREAHQAAVQRDPRAGRTEAASRLPGAGSPGHAVRGRDRPGTAGGVGDDLQQAPDSRAGHRHLLPGAHHRPPVRRHVQRQAQRGEPARGPAVYRRRRGPGHLRAHEGSGHALGDDAAGPDRARAGSHDHRGDARRAPRLHRV